VKKKGERKERNKGIMKYRNRSEGTRYKGGKKPVGERGTQVNMKRNDCKFTLLSGYLVGSKSLSGIEVPATASWYERRPW
jgi:hypothetical protein